MLGLIPGTVTLSDYDPQWPEDFRREAERLLNATSSGPDHGPIKEIAHIGSTSIPGMMAKPMIDMMVGLHTLGDVAALIPILNRMGYDYKGEFGIPDRHFFTLGNPTTHHVHMVFHDGPFWKLNLLFRNHLRAHPPEAAAYVALKRELAAKFANNRESYTKGKDAFIRSMLARAGWRG
ncbi:MAG: GrpB family protein [Phycisphaerales bacterium]